jgi:hypothetical protein
MDEYILTTVYRDEAVALVRVEPLDGALRHFRLLLLVSQISPIPPRDL